jgi:hypothetical protein
MNLLLVAEELRNMVSLTSPITKSTFQGTSQPTLLVSIPEKERRDTQIDVKINFVLGASSGATDSDIAVTGYKTIHVLTTSDIVSSGVGKSHRSQAVTYLSPHDV